MVEKNHPQLSIRKQCEILDVNRNWLHSSPKKTWSPNAIHLEMIELMKLAHAKDNTMGARQLRKILKRNGYETSRWTVRKMMKYAGIKAVYCKPKTTVPAPQNPTYPYLLKDIEITLPDQVWATDITYIPWHKGHVYLTAVIDWKTRAILSWKLSNTMDEDFCVATFHEALQRSGTTPEIVNTDQGSQYTGAEWIKAVKGCGAKVSMDGKGQWVDNVIIERFWRSVKHEWILLHEYQTLPELEALIGEWIDRYNKWRPNSANEGRTPWQEYRSEEPVLEREELKRGESLATSAPEAPAATAPRASGALVAKKAA